MEKKVSRNKYKLLCACAAFTLQYDHLTLSS